MKNQIRLHPEHVPVGAGTWLRVVQVSVKAVTEVDRETLIGLEVKTAEGVRVVPQILANGSVSQVGCLK